MDNVINTDSVGINKASRAGVINEYWIKKSKNYIEDIIVNNNELTDLNKQSLITLYANITLDNAQSSYDLIDDIVKAHREKKNMENNHILYTYLIFSFLLLYILLIAYYIGLVPLVGLLVFLCISLENAQSSYNTLCNLINDTIKIYREKKNMKNNHILYLVFLFICILLIIYYTSLETLFSLLMCISIAIFLFIHLISPIINFA